VASPEGIASLSPSSPETKVDESSGIDPSLPEPPDPLGMVASTPPLEPLSPPELEPPPDELGPGTKLAVAAPLQAGKTRRTNAARPPLKCGRRRRKRNSLAIELRL
jgi:hypothetical protein